MNPSVLVRFTGGAVCLRWVIFAAYSLLVAFLCLSPAPSVENIPLLFAHADKLVHASLFGVQTVLLLHALPRPVSRPRTVLAAAVCTLYGIALEFLQSMHPGAGRTFDRIDMVANAVGAAAAAGLTFRIASGKFFIKGIGRSGPARDRRSKEHT